MATLNRGTLLRVFLYIVIAVLPLALGLIDLDPGRGFWINFSVALGFVGLSMFGLQFLLAARSRIVANHVGMDRLLEFHKQMSYVATLFVFAHPIILFFVDTRFLGLLDFPNAPLRAQFAVTSVAVLVIMIALSIWRKQLHIKYETWQVWHAILALTVVITALLHVILVGYYVRDPWETVLWIALSIAFVALGLWVRIIKPLLRHRRKWQVESVEPAPGGAHTITLTLVNPQAYGPGGFRFKAGQFAWITARRSAFSMTYHPFSFSSSAELHNRVRFTIKTQEGFTTNIGELQPGEIVYLDGPYGSFALPDEKTAGPLILIGAGVGVTPLQSMLETLADRGSARHCEIWLANRNQDSITGGAELAALAPRLNLTIRHVLSRPEPGWDGESGRLDADFVRRHLPSDAALGTYFLCGPGGLMDAAIAALVSSGVPRANIHAERFDMV